MSEGNLTALRALQSLERTGSISATAAELGLTQSAVSRAISGFEAGCKLTLVHRGARPLRLTEEGEAAAAHARRITGNLTALEQDLTSLRLNRSGTVRAGSFGPSASVRLLPRLLLKFKQLYPGIDVSLEEGNDEKALNDLVHERVDVSMLADPGEEFETLPVATDKLVALLPSEHQASEPLTQQDMANAPFIMTLAGSEPYILDWFRRGGTEPRITHRVQQTHSILALVAAGLGRAIVTDLSLPQDTPGVQAVPLAGAPAKEIVLARKHRPPRSRAAGLFWQTAAREL